jgi:hypothetical protein
MDSAQKSFYAIEVRLCHPHSSLGCEAWISPYSLRIRKCVRRLVHLVARAIQHVDPVDHFRCEQALNAERLLHDGSGRAQHGKRHTPLAIPILAPHTQIRPTCKAQVNRIQAQQTQLIREHLHLLMHVARPL